MDRRLAVEFLIVLLIIIGLFAAWMVKLDLKLVHLWAIGATLGLVAVAVAILVKLRRG